MTNIATNAVAFVIVLGFLIFAHESGHFFMAKLLKVKVLVFSFGFGKRLFGFHRGDTDYRVSLIPLGGYVRMAGDIPEENVPVDPHDFLARPKWQRFLILVAGPAMNLVIAVAFLAGFYMLGTEVVRDSRPILGSVLPGRAAAAAGLRPMDEIVEANGEPIRDWDDFRLAISMNAGAPVHLRYRRNGLLQSTTITPKRQQTDFGTIGVAGVTVYGNTEVGRVFKNSAADRAGFRQGDFLVSVAGHPTAQVSEVELLLENAKGAAVPVTLRRGPTLVSTTLPSSASAPISYPGFAPPTVVRKYGPVAALNESLGENWKMLKYTFVTIKRLFRSEGSMKEISGPISIARISGEMLRTGWLAVGLLMAQISLQLGVMNLLPIPVLDGGHIFILLVEGAARRDLSVRVKERIQQLGFAALAALMLVVIYNDVVQNVMLMRKG